MEKTRPTMDDLIAAISPKKYHLPKMRYFIVRYYANDEKGMQEKTIEAHIVQDEPPTICRFVDVELEEGVPVTRLHHIFFNVVEVEEVFRVPTMKKLLAH